MKVGRIVLCYPDMDRIVVDKKQDLGRYDLSKINAAEVKVILSVEEFKALIEKSSLPG